MKKTRESNTFQKMYFFLTKKISISLTAVLMLFLFFKGVFMSAEDAYAKPKDEVFYSNPSFSHDSQKLAFDRYTDIRNLQIHVIDLATKEITYYQSPLGLIWLWASFSPDGKQLVFTQVPLLPATKEGRDLDWVNSQIGIMDVDGRNVRMLTQTPGVKKTPNFSWSGKKVIYVQAKLRKPGSKTRDSGNDVYEIDLETGVNRQLTNLQFSQMVRPTYLPGDQSFVVSTDLPSNMRGLSVMETHTYWSESARKNRNSRVQRFEVTDSSETFNTLFTDLFSAANVEVDAAGNIYFEAQPTAGDKLRVYRFTPTAHIQSWPIKAHLQPSGNAISPNGRWWVEASKSASNDDDLNGIYALDLIVGTWQEIPANGPAKRINP